MGRPKYQNPFARPIAPSVLPTPVVSNKPRGMILKRADNPNGAAIGIENGDDDYVTVLYPKDGPPCLAIRRPDDFEPMVITRDGIRLARQEWEPVRQISWDKLYALVERFS